MLLICATMSIPVEVTDSYTICAPVTIIILVFGGMEIVVGVEINMTEAVTFRHNVIDMDEGSSRLSA